MASGKSDEIKGRVKEAAGALTGDKKLKREGKTDQAVGKAKQAVQKAADTVKKAVKKATRKVAAKKAAAKRKATSGNIRGSPTI